MQVNNDPESAGQKPGGSLERLTPPGFYDRALRRIGVMTLFLGAAGTVALFATKGSRPAVGFLMGVALSIVNFQGLCMLANALGASRKPGLLAGLFIGLRYLLVGIALYVIVKLLGFAAVPVLAGLLAPFGAALLEILYELIFPVHA
jgi:hypothetical protein